MKKIILALDISDIYQAKRIVNQTYQYVDIYKIGPGLFIEYGRSIIDYIIGINKKIFLDLKLYDIPITVQRAVKAAYNLGVFSLTIHASGGEKMMKAVTSVVNRPKIWAVTILTSEATSTEKVLQMVKIANSCDVDGVISSPLEIESIKKQYGKTFNVITPGIRLQNQDNDDQLRVSTPINAIKKGADFIVIGRTILKDKNPIETLKKIYEDIQNLT
ncbi:MAG: orotidine-5'-phosphate decarboxylase [Endomicrobium sp.]|nr:orotidine-5'-phosphate decarboxylase [Endomicrobium sp.]